MATAVYLCLVHVDRVAEAAFSAAERAALDEEHRRFGTWLTESGHGIVCASLQPPDTATVLRSTRGQLSMTDGPYVETKEYLGGFMLIRAADRDAALAIAARSPVTRYGAVEVRAVNYVEQ